MSIAKAFYKNWAVDASGDIVPGSAVTVRRLYDGQLATLYSTEGGAALANPFTAADDGSYEFYVDKEDAYSVVVGTAPTSSAHTVFLLVAGATFPSVTALASAVTAGASWPDDKVVATPKVQFVTDSGAAVTGLPAGLLPYGWTGPDHWEDNATPGTTDMSDALEAAAEYDKDLTLLAATYRISREIRIYGRNGFRLTGAGPGQTLLAIDTGSFDVLTFYTGQINVEGVPLSNQDIELRGFKMNTPAGADRTGGHYVNFEERGVRCKFTDLVLDNYYSGIRCTAMAYSHLDRVLTFGTRRTTTGGNTLTLISDAAAGRYFPNEAANGAKCTDLHITNCNFNSDGALLNPYAVAMYIGCADGVYVINSHLRGATDAVVLETALSPNRTVLSSVDFTNCYFDGVAGSHVVFKGFGNGETYTPTGASDPTTIKFRDINFRGCRARYAKGANGSFSAAMTQGYVDYVEWSGGKIRDNPRGGIRSVNASSGFRYYSIKGVTFYGNNTDAAGLYEVGVTPGGANHGDIYVYDNGGSIQNNVFRDGHASGYAIRAILSGGDLAVISGNDVRGSIAGTKIDSPSNVVFGNPGYKQVNSGTATLLSGTTEIAVTHGLDNSPQSEDIRLTMFDATVSGITRIGVKPGSVTSTQFVIESNAAPAANFRIQWHVDAEKRHP